jgi:hypothetical protein
MIVSMMNLSESDIFPITTNNITDYKKYIYICYAPIITQSLSKERPDLVR